MAKNSFVMYNDWASVFIGLPNDKAGELIKAIYDYQMGNEPQFDDVTLSAVFNLFKNRFDVDKAKYEEKSEKNRENGSKGGKQKVANNKQKVANGKQNVANATERKRTDSESKRNVADNDNDNDNVNDNVNVNENVNDNLNVRKKESKKEKAEKIIAMYNTQCPSLPKAITLTEARIKSVNARLKDYTEDEIETAFVKAENSSFLRGEKGEWKADFDWLMNPNNIVKVLEGRYDNKEQSRLSIVDNW